MLKLNVIKANDLIFHLFYFVNFVCILYTIDGLDSHEHMTKHLEKHIKISKIAYNMP